MWNELSEWTCIFQRCTQFCVLPRNWNSPCQMIQRLMKIYMKILNRGRVIICYSRAVIRRCFLFIDLDRLVLRELPFLSFLAQIVFTSGVEWCGDTGDCAIFLTKFKWLDNSITSIGWTVNIRSSFPFEQLASVSWMRINQHKKVDNIKSSLWVLPINSGVYPNKHTWWCRIRTRCYKWSVFFLFNNWLNLNYWNHFPINCYYWLENRWQTDTNSFPTLSCIAVGLCWMNWSTVESKERTPGYLTQLPEPRIRHHWFHRFISQVFISNR